MPRNLKPKVAILVNIVAPYWLPIYRRIGDEFATIILCSGHEDNRSMWILENQLSALEVRRSWGFTLKLRRAGSGKVFDYWYLHINPGYVLDLLRIRPDAVISNEMGFRTLVALVYGTLFRKPVWVWWGALCIPRVLAVR